MSTTFPATCLLLQRPRHTLPNQRHDAQINTTHPRQPLQPHAHAARPVRKHRAPRHCFICLVCSMSLSYLLTAAQTLLLKHPSQCSGPHRSTHHHHKVHCCTLHNTELHGKLRSPAPCADTCTSSPERAPSTSYQHTLHCLHASPHCHDKTTASTSFHHKPSHNTLGLQRFFVSPTTQQQSTSPHHQRPA